MFKNTKETLCHGEEVHQTKSEVRRGSAIYVILFY